MHSGWRMKPDSKLRHKPEKTINSMLKIFKEKSNFYILLCIIGFKFAQFKNSVDSNQDFNVR